jgi:hypothetical protein
MWGVKGILALSLFVTISHGWQWPWNLSGSGSRRRVMEDHEEVNQLHPLSDAMINHINNNLQPHWTVFL